MASKNYERQRRATLKRARELAGLTPEQRAAYWAEKAGKALAKVRAYEAKAETARTAGNDLASARADAYAETWRREYVRCGGVNISCDDDFPSARNNPPHTGP